MNDSKIFADIFNYFLFDGEKVINPEKLMPADTTVYAVPYGNDARTPIQRYRDCFKVWNVMSDSDGVYVLLGSEIQNKVHYAMPVKDELYDAIGYASQVDAARRSYRKKSDKADEDAEVSVEGDAVKIKLTREEFLSGFRKTDKLTPIITVVIYFGGDEWDGPMSIHEMLAYKDARILKAIPDYRINLVAPYNIPDEDFDEKFSTGLGVVLNAIKYSKANFVEFVQNIRRKSIDRRSALFLRDGLELPIEFEDKDVDEKGDVNVSEATKEYLLKTEITGAIKAYQQIGMLEEDIIKNILKQYDVTEQYVRDLMHTAA